MTEELPLCQDCGGVLHPEYDNVGFTPPEGPPHWELVSYYCPVCDSTDEDL